MHVRVLYTRVYNSCMHARVLYTPLCAVFGRYMHGYAFVKCAFVSYGHSFALRKRVYLNDKCVSFLYVHDLFICKCTRVFALCIVYSLFCEPVG